LVWQATRETLKRHIAEFGELLRKDNEVGLVVDGQVSEQIVIARTRKNY